MAKNIENNSTEEKILEAAKKVFIQKGMYGARMQEIADEAGINKALLHYYFRSKDQLFEAIFQEAFTEFIPKAFSVFESEKPFEEKLKSFVANYIDVLSANPYLPIFMLNEINQNPTRLGHMVNMMGIIKEKVSIELKVNEEAGKYRAMDTVQLLTMIIGMTLFPYLARPIMKGAFVLDDETFLDFLEERKILIPEIIMNYLKIKD